LGPITNVLKFNTLVIANVAKKMNSSHVSKCRVFCSESIWGTAVADACAADVFRAKARPKVCHRRHSRDVCQVFDESFNDSLVDCGLHDRIGFNGADFLLCEQIANERVLNYSN
jgi:hypothetical protein